MTGSRPLYARVMGSAWEQVSEPVRAAHATEPIIRGVGRLRIVHGDGIVADWLARLLRLPRASGAVDTRLVITSREDREQWLRTFDDRRLDTLQYATADGALAERIGILELRFRLDVLEGSLIYRQVGAALRLGWFHLRLPARWAPTVDAREDPAGARQIRVGVRLTLPGIGPVLAYDGLIAIEDTQP